MAVKKRPASASRAPAQKRQKEDEKPSDANLKQCFASASASSGPRALLAKAKPQSMELPLASTALICIDFQGDFLDKGGFANALGNNVTKLAKECLPGAATLLAAARAPVEAGGLPLVVHTKEAHRADLLDCPSSKLKGPRCPPPGKRIGDVMVRGMGRLLVDGSPGNDFVEAVKPIPGEIIICKPGKGAFFMTGLHDLLRERKISHLIVCGITTEVCVQTTLREANDRGYECVLVEDATGSYFPAFKKAFLKMVSSQGGIVGFTVKTAKEVATALGKAS